MHAALSAPLTAEDYRLLPEAGPRYQLIEGDLFMAPAPNRYHQDISGYIHFLLRAYLEKHRVGKLYGAPFDVFLDEINVYQPDLVFISKQNFSVLTDAGAVGAPDLVVEILSTGRRTSTRSQNCGSMGGAAGRNFGSSILTPGWCMCTRSQRQWNAPQPRFRTRTRSLHDSSRDRSSRPPAFVGGKIQATSAASHLA